MKKIISGEITTTTIVITRENMGVIFKKIAKNRGVRMEKSAFKKLKRSIRTREQVLDPIKYVEVEEDGGIVWYLLDGQHRVEACIELVKEGVYDEIELKAQTNSKYTVDDIITLNNNTDGWNNYDRVDSYATDGNWDAQRVLEYINEYQSKGFKLTGILQAFIDSKTKVPKTALEEGINGYKINIEKGKKILESLRLLESLSPLAIGSKPIEAMRKIVWENENFDAHELRRKIVALELSRTDLDNLFNVNSYSEVKHRLLGIYKDEE